MSSSEGAPPADTARPRAPGLGSSFSDVIAAAQADGAWAYRRLFDTYGRQVAGYLRGRGAEDPEGLANDVFLRAFTNIRGFVGDESRFRSWLFTIAHHRLVDDLRRQSRRPERSDDEVAHIDPHTMEAADGAAMRALGLERVHVLLGQLSEDQRSVLLLRIVADLTVEQVAAVIGKRPGAVKQLQRRGLARLRSLVDPAEETPR